MTTTTRDLVARLHANPDDNEAKGLLCAALIREGHGPDITRLALFNAQINIALLYGHAGVASSSSEESQEAMIGVSQHIARWIDALDLDALMGDQAESDAGVYREAAKDNDRRWRERHTQARRRAVEPGPVVRDRMRDMIRENLGRAEGDEDDAS